MKALLSMLFFVSPLVFFLLAGMAHGGVWNSSYEGTPGDGTHANMTNSTARSAIDDHARNQRQNVRYRAQPEHFWGSGDVVADDNGLHRLGSARCYMSATAPVILSDSHSGVSGLSDYLNTVQTGGGGAVGLEDSASNSAAAAEDDVGHGRCWIDTDDNNRLYLYVGEAGDDTPSNVADGWVPASSLGSNNIIFHGSFEGTDGDGDASSTTIPYGWTVLGTVTSFAYGTPDVSDGEGLALQIVAGAANSGIQQTLGGLHASTWYRFSARAKAASGDTCQIAITGDSRTVPTASNDSTTATSMTTLTVLALTDSTPTDLVLRLEGVANTDDCTWDHVSVERLSGPAAPGSLVLTDVFSGSTNCTTSYAGTCANLVTVDVTPPSHGYHAFILASARCSLSAAGEDYAMQIHDGSSELEEVIVTAGVDTALTTEYPIFHMTRTVLVPGVTVTYALNVKEITTADCTATDANMDVLLINSGR